MPTLGNLVRFREKKQRNVGISSIEWKPPKKEEKVNIRKNNSPSFCHTNIQEYMYFYAHVN